MKLSKSPKEGTGSSGVRPVIPQPDHQSVLLLVHLQHDFCPGGALPVTGGDEVIPLANACVRLFGGQGLPVIATRDWHPPNHCSFTEQGGPWPVHCVQGSRGAQFHEQLSLPMGTLIISGATDFKQEAYSGFDGTSLADHLEGMGAHTLFVLGLATDYCVKETVLDARKRGFQVVVIENGIRGIEVNPGDSEHALQEMYAAGAMKATTSDIGVTNHS